MSQRGHGVRVVVSIASVAVVTGAIFGLKAVAPVLSLGILYLLAVLPAAVFFGLGYALFVSIASMLAFNFFFLAPLHSLALPSRWRSSCSPRTPRTRAFRGSRRSSPATGSCRASS
jgi:K+-sensing histidine kinase KdpD